MTPPTAPMTSTVETDVADTPADRATDATTGAATDAVPGDDEVVAEELLVEEVSIDGMCGVY